MKANPPGAQPAPNAAKPVARSSASKPSGSTAPKDPKDPKEASHPSKEAAKKAADDNEAKTCKLNTAAGDPTKKPAQKSADKKAADKKKKERVAKREKMKENDVLKSDNFTWKIIKLLGSGGFGDVYKVVKQDNEDKKEYAMKTEMCEGDKRMLRLKIEVRVLGLCQNVENPEKRRHFIELVDRGKTEKFKGHLSKCPPTPFSLTSALETDYIYSLLRKLKNRVLHEIERCKSHD
ncbi:hypothetical protein Y032_0017g3289 [Ancylostoma ceylanicum]|uniref:Protein kinase domain-containing protein n=1 Tax=Ancylostoma ceylanicum TaxID=53326 RepID=A0A016V6G9_9BILA|nr:hypothetical protein Y032_0017g3289 [Ancylostoma ceylanicum]